MYIYSQKKWKFTGIGEVRYHRQLKAEGLEPRDSIVWLPPGIGSGNRRNFF